MFKVKLSVVHHLGSNAMFVADKVIELPFAPFPELCLNLGNGSNTFCDDFNISEVFWETETKMFVCLAETWRYDSLDELMEVKANFLKGGWTIGHQKPETETRKMP